MNVEFQRIARTDKKAFLGDQCKEIEENSRIRKTRDVFKKINEPWSGRILYALEQLSPYGTTT